MTERKEPAWARRWREAQQADAEEEEEKARLEEESIKEDEKRVDELFKESEENEIRERKLAILSTIEKQLEESGRQDEQAKEELKQIADLKEKLKSWNAVLENPRWEQILRTYFRVVYAMTKGMAQKTVVTITETDGTINFSYDYFDENGSPITTEYSDGAKEALDEEKEEE